MLLLPLPLRNSVDEVIQHAILIFEESLNTICGGTYKEGKTMTSLQEKTVTYRALLL